MGWTTGVQFPAGTMLGFFLFAIASRPALRPTRNPIQWMPGVLTPGMERSGHRADHSPPFIAEVNNEWRYSSIPQYVLMMSYLVKHRDVFTLTLPLPLDLPYLYIKIIA